MIHTIALACLTFACTFIADFAWTMWTQGVAEKRPVKAASWSAGIVLLSAVTVLVYTGSPFMIIPAMAGAFAGTLVAMEYGS